MADDNQLAEATQALSFAEFLERMKDPQAVNLVRTIRKYVCSGTPSIAQDYAALCVPARSALQIG